MDEQKNILNELSKIKKENPFRAPDHYFDDFAARLQNRLDTEIQAEQKQSNKVIRYLKPVLAMAASFALILLLVQWPLKSFLPNQVAQSSESTELNDIEYVTIVEELDESSFFAILDEPVTTSDFTDEDLENYIAANTSDYEIFIGTEN